MNAIPTLYCRVDVLDSYMAYQECGLGRAVVFLHGNPTSSYVWRNVIPMIAAEARCLAPDLIGMGKSGKPDLPYRFVDHARYLEAWFQALRLKDVVLVGYDWGGALALDWAARHPGHVRGVVVFETFLRPLAWREWPPLAAELFRALRTPGVGEQMVLEENQFLARSLDSGIKRTLTDEERAQYFAPFPTPASRRPVLQWPREIPIDGKPADVVSIVNRYIAWAASSSNVPKLLIAFDVPSVLGSADVVSWAQRSFAALDVALLGPAGHHAAEDLPHEIGASIAAWLESHALTATTNSCERSTASPEREEGMPTPGVLDTGVATRRLR